MKLSAEQPYAEAAATVIAARAEVVFAQRRKDVLDIGEIEGVHAMRVATRRLRAALEVFGPCLERKRFAPALAEVKALAGALGERRDRDVQLELLTRLHSECTGDERRAVELLAKELGREQRRANRALAVALAHAKASGLRQRLAGLAK
jgi:CHAD domain-containing protein